MGQLIVFLVVVLLYLGSTALRWNLLFLIWVV